MAKNLLIVESPAKAKTIEKYLGSQYQVLSSYGHIRDLPKSGLNIDIEHNFKPNYEIPADSQKTISQLKKAIKNKIVLLATDEDREGEAISWHLCKALNLDEKNTPRIVFHEITKEALQKAVNNPRNIDMNLVDAQQARRVLDRLVGYELSPVLMKKIHKGLSAGRVQSVAVRLIVEREREIESFKPIQSYKVTAEFETVLKDIIQAELRTKVETTNQVTKLMELLKNAKFEIDSLSKKPSKKSPSPPFTTSTLQQAASNVLGYSVRQTMVLAQKLYENGKITYMRTDSLNLSNSAITQAQKHILDNFGEKYYKQQNYKAKSAGAQEAHEAIRPTDFSLEKASEDNKQQKLYNLIRARALASQMSEALIERTEVIIKQDKSSDIFIAKGEILQFDGFLKVYGESNEDKIIPDLKRQDLLNANFIQAKTVFSKPPARYTEASLVKKLESEGIGRPSTYAPTISTIQNRGYIEKTNKDPEKRDIELITLQNNQIQKTTQTENFGAEKNKLFPTDTGKVVTDFLTKFFAEIVDYKFTATVEKEFDKIAQGQDDWTKVIKQFYIPFHKLIVASEDITRQEANQARILGKDPKTGKPVTARLGRYGAMLQIGDAEDDKKPLFAPMPAGEQIHTVSLDQALEMFKLPRTLGKTKDGEEIITNIGRFGPYIKFGNTFVSIKDEDPFNITLKKAQQYINQKKKTEAERVIANFENDGIRVLNGRYGPYVTDGKTNAKVPADTDPKKLTAKDAKEILNKKTKN